MTTRFDPVRLRAAIDHAIAIESPWAREPGENWGVHHPDPPPYNRLLGPVSARGPASGVILQRGRTVGHWGQPLRPDLTFSIAKTYLALLAGVAFDRGLIDDVDAPVVSSLPGIGFDCAHNRTITWAHLLQQTSEWEGTLFGVPDQVDRNRVVTYDPTPPRGRKGDPRPLRPPGSHWEYNDVRINQLSWALMHLFRRPLPEVFEEAVMRPIGASGSWRWVGYDNAWTTLDGRTVQSVPGGTHWGGGMTIHAADQARIGQVMLNDGLHDGHPVISAEWLGRMREPCALAPFYGYLIWLNGDRRVFPAAPASSWFAIGAGSSIMWVDAGLELVVVARWIDGARANEFVSRVMDAIA